MPTTGACLCLSPSQLTFGELPLRIARRPVSGTALASATGMKLDQLAAWTAGTEGKPQPRRVAAWLLRCSAPGTGALGGSHRPATSVRRVLRRHRIGPAPRRGGPTWTQFLRNQTSSLLATDFFTVETVGLAPAVRAVRGAGAATVGAPGGDHRVLLTAACTRTASPGRTQPGASARPASPSSTLSPVPKTATSTPRPLPSDP